MCIWVQRAHAQEQQLFPCHATPPALQNWCELVRAEPGNQYIYLAAIHHAAAHGCFTCDPAALIYIEPSHEYALAFGLPAHSLRINRRGSCSTGSDYGTDHARDCQPACDSAALCVTRVYAVLFPSLLTPSIVRLLLRFSRLRRHRRLVQVGRTAHSRTRVPAATSHRAFTPIPLARDNFRASLTPSHVSRHADSS